MAGDRANRPILQERGFHNVKSFDAGEMNSGTQNFSITQGEKGTIFVGNLGGVSVFDGAFWQLIPLPNDSAVRKIRTSAKGTVLVAGYNEIGVLKQNIYNQLSYQSLKTQLPTHHREFGDIISIYIVGDGAYFHTEKFLFHWMDGRLSLSINLRHKQTPVSFFTHNDVLYQQTGSQVFSVPEKKSLMESLLPSQVLYSLSDDLLLLKNGHIHTLGTSLQNTKTLALERWLSGTRISEIARLDAARVAIATRDKGIVIIDMKATILEILDLSSGLPLNDVRGLWFASDGSLWLALNAGAARVDISSNTTLFDQRSQLDGIIHDLYRLNQTLFTGTSSGLFFLSNDWQALKGNHGISRAIRVNKTPMAVWDLHPGPNPDELLVGTSQGLFVFKENSLKLLPETKTNIIYCIQNSTIHPSYFILGMEQGLALMRRNQEHWEFSGALDGLPKPIRSIEEDSHGDIWVGTTFEGLFRIRNLTTPQGFNGLNIDKLHFGDGEANCFWLSKELCFAIDGVIQHLDVKTQRLKSHPVMDHIPKGNLYLAQEDFYGNFWINTDPVTRISFPPDQPPYVDNYTFRNLPGHDVQHIFPEPNGATWLTSEVGLSRVVSTLKPQIHFSPEIGKVSLGNQLFPYHDHESKTGIPYSASRMRIEFAPLCFEQHMQYQYRLEPSDLSWSNWSEQAFTEYTNLWEGSYTFKMRMKDTTGGFTPEASFTFVVLPPWYRSLFAYFAYAIGIIFCFTLFFKWRFHRLEKHAHLLENKVEQKTAQLSSTLNELKTAKNEVEQKNSALEQANLILENMTLLDGLTEIANRRHFDRFLIEEWRRCRRLGMPISAILLDIDHFKKLNDRYGHLQGDQCLKLIASYLKDLSLRKTDLVARYGGEEFAIILPNCNLEDARQLAEEIRTGMEDLMIPHQDSSFKHVTASLGVTCIIPQLKGNSKILVQQADNALYKAKSNGRNRVEVFS